MTVMETSTQQRPTARPEVSTSGEADQGTAMSNTVEQYSGLQGTLFPKDEDVALEMVKNVLGDQYSESELREVVKKSKLADRYNVESVIDKFLANKIDRNSTDTGGVSNAAGSANPPYVHPTDNLNPSPLAKYVDNLKGGINQKDNFDTGLGRFGQQTSSSAGAFGSVSKEELEISKAIEESMSCSGLRQDAANFDHPNPYERERICLEWPVGLKNIGNSCWFSVVIQALFHLPAFRNKVLNWTLGQTTHKSDPSYPSSSSDSFPELVCDDFMKELKELFALLLGSNRKYVDPSKVFNVLKTHEKRMEFSSGLWNNQQDVSEFTHTLLDWMEKGFNPKVEDVSQPSTSETKPLEESVKEGRIEGDRASEIYKFKGPVKEFFYGSKEETKRTELGFESRETEFAQYTLQVAGCLTLHDSIEESLCPRMEQPASSCYEHWLTKLPPVLLFELNRFQFNQAEGRTEKIHSCFCFPKEIFMDRYLSSNKEIVRTKRNKVNGLRIRLKQLKDQLYQYENYGSGAKKMPLVDVLDSTMDFVKAFFKCSDVVMSSPVPSTSGAEQNFGPEEATVGSVSSQKSVGREPSLPSNSPPSLQQDDIPMETDAVSAENKLAYLHAQLSGKISSETDENAKTETTSSSDQQTHGCGEDLTVDVERPLTPPHPGHVAESERATFQECLTRWKMEVVQSVRNLKTEIEGLEGEVNTIYDETELQNHKYHLHAVLVHSGQANMGHYWAYIYDPKLSQWRKFDDTRVTESQWTELEEDCRGDKWATSAYCLIYVALEKDELFDGYQTVTEDYLKKVLPEDLQSLVELDNVQFVAEKIEWDQKHPDCTVPEMKGPGAAAAVEKSQTEINSGGELRLEVNEELFKKYRKLAVSEEAWKTVINNAIEKVGQGIEARMVVENELKNYERNQQQRVSEYVDRMVTEGREICTDGDPRCEDIYSFIVSEPSLDPFVKDGKLLQWILVHHFGTAIAEHKTIDSKSKTKLVTVIEKMRERVGHLSDAETKLFNEFCSQYDKFVKLTVIVWKTLELFLEGKDLDKPLLQAVVAMDRNRELSSFRGKPSPGYMVYPTLIKNLRRLCLLRKCVKDVKSIGASMTDANKVKDVLKYYNKEHGVIFGIMQELAQGTNSLDQKVFTTIEQIWCTAFDPETNPVKTTDTENMVGDIVGEILDLKNKTSKFNVRHFTVNVTVGSGVKKAFSDALRSAEGSRLLLSEAELEQAISNWDF